VLLFQTLGRAQSVIVAQTQLQRLAFQT